MAVTERSKQVCHLLANAVVMTERVPVADDERHLPHACNNFRRAHDLKAIPGRPRAAGPKVLYPRAVNVERRQAGTGPTTRAEVGGRFAMSEEAAETAAGALGPELPQLLQPDPAHWPQRKRTPLQGPDLARKPLLLAVAAVPRWGPTAL
jgi:hypothetical protein